MQLADEAGVGFVCVQSLKVHLAREADDYTRDKTDHKDAVLIGKLISRLDCYLPERAEEDWARLRHLGQRRFRLVGEVVACRNQISDLLSCCWPAALECAIKPLESTTWLACLAVTVDRCNGNPAKLRKLGRDRFFAVVRRELPRFGAQRVCHRVAGQFFAALTDGRGVATQRRGALERVGLLMDDWRSTLARLAEVEARMVAVLNGLGLTAVVTSIPGLSAVGAAVILAETGDLNRFASARSVVKHAGGEPGREHLRDLPRADPGQPPRPARAARRGLAGRVGRAAPQPRAGRQVHPPDHPRTRPARPGASPRRLRRGSAALAARHHHQATTVEPRHRQRHHGRPPGTRYRSRLTTRRRRVHRGTGDNLTDHPPTAGRARNAA
jgi:hypothetical protein